MKIIRFLGKLFGVEEHAQKLLFLCAVTNIITFYFTRIIAHDFHHYDISLPIDNLIPCIAFPWSYIYLVAFPIWAFCYITYANQSYAHAKDLFMTDTIGKIVCFICFVAFPTQMPAFEMEATNYSTFLINFIWFLDTPNNLFPSIHILVSWISWLKFKQMHTVSDRTKALILLIVVLISFSILFTKQHVILDIPSALLLAFVGDFISNRTFKKEKRLEMDRIDKEQAKNGKIIA